MSWSLSAQGTKAGACAQLDSCSIYGTASVEERATFDKARAILKDLILNHGYECSPESNGRKAETVFKATAAGHGKQITSLSISYEIVFVS